MPDISAILKNKGISLADTNESKILSSLNGLFQRPVEPIHFSKLISNKNQFYREEELEELADTILLLGGIAQNLLVRKSALTGTKFWSDTGDGAPAKSWSRSVVIRSLHFFHALPSNAMMSPQKSS